MKKINTGGITTNKRLPFYGNRAIALTGIDFIQQAHLDTQQAIMGMCVTDDTKCTILYGAALTPWTVGSGYVFYRVHPSDQGEIFEVPLQAVGAPPMGMTHLKAIINPDPTDKVPNYSILSDGSQVSVHEKRTITLQWSAAIDSGDLPDFDHWIPNAIAVSEAFIIALVSDVTILQSYIPGSWLPLSGLGTYAAGWGPGNDINGIDTPYYRIVTDPTGTYIEFKGSVGIGLTTGAVTKQTIMTGVALTTARANIGSVVFSGTDSFAAIAISNETAVFYYSLSDQKFYLTTPTNTLDMNKMILDGTKWYLS